jgi:hypothetical protein
MWICRPGFICGSCMMALHTFSSCSSGILEQRVSGTVDRTRWTNSMACSFPRFKALRLSSLRTLQSTVCATEVGAVPDLQQRVQNGSETILRHLEFSSESGNH